MEIYVKLAYSIFFVLSFLELSDAGFHVGDCKLSWNDAKNYCRLSGNGELFQPKDTTLYKEAARHKANERKWIGVRRASPHNYIWVGVSFGFLKLLFSVNEPNDAGGQEDCLELIPNGLLNDVRCGSLNYPLCYK